MQPTPELIDELYRERVLRARQMSPEEKLLAGPQLFDDVCERMRAGIGSQYPDANEQRVNQILAERVNRLRQIEEYPIYQPAGERR